MRGEGRGYCTRHIKAVKSSFINLAKPSLPHECCRAMNVAEPAFSRVNLERTLLYVGRWLHLQRDEASFAKRQGACETLEMVR